MLWIVILSLALLCGWLTTGGARRRRMLQLAGRMPGPPAYPLVGNALVFMARPEDQLKIIGRYFDQYGQYVRFWLGPDLNVCVKNPGDIRLVLTSNKVNQKGPLYDVLKSFIGPGILTGGSSWRNHRKIATPSYSKRSVRLYSQIFNEQGQSLAQTLSQKDPEVTFDVYRDLVQVTTRCVCQTLLGLSKEDANTIKRLDEVVSVTHEMYTFIFKKMTRWWLQILPVFWLTGSKKVEDFYLKMIDDLASDILAKRRKAMQNHSDEDTIGVVDRCILSQDLSEKELKWETFTLFTTSQEAAAKIASAVLLFLAHLSEWQEKVYKEILEVLGPEGPVSYEDLKRLEHLDMVFKEACRYLSIAAFIQRTVEDEITIKNGEITVPIGASVIIPIHMLHRDPEYWENPNKVDPGRFLPENTRTRDPNAFVPFSLGPMDCLGRIYATALIKTLVVHVLRSVQLQADGRLEDLELHVAISVKFADGYNLRARPRKRRS